MAMGFRDFITNRIYRRQLAEEFQQADTVRPPANPSRRYVDKLTRRLLRSETAAAAYDELAMIGAAAVPPLIEALKDPAFQLAEWPGFSPAPAPYFAVLELLAPHAPEVVVATAAARMDDASDAVRKTVAYSLASLGMTSTLPMLERLLEDKNAYVRAALVDGVRAGVESGRASAEFRERMFEMLLAKCDEDWFPPGNNAPQALVCLDRQRAAKEFGSARWLSIDNQNARDILGTCNESGIVLGDDLLRRLFEQSIDRAVGEHGPHYAGLAAGALDALVTALGQQARPLLETVSGHEQPAIREAAATGLLRLAGVDDAFKFVCDRLEKCGFEALTVPQRTVYCAIVFDIEVCNGGIMQFFGNSSGSCVVETLEALHAVGDVDAAGELAAAMKAVGPLAREPDDEMRLAAFEGRFDELQDMFGPLESAYYDRPDQLTIKVLQYAAAHAEHFRAGD